MNRAILPHVIFSPGTLALDLANGLQTEGVAVTLFTPGPVDTTATNVIADLSYFEQELSARGDNYMDLLKKHPFTFITLARQVQSEILADVIKCANNDEFDIIHIYTNEEDTALPLAKLSNKPVVFTHHDPFNFLIKYRSIFPKYKHLNWLSLSYSQRKGMPIDTNWTANIYHGIALDVHAPQYDNTKPYVAYLGRIIKPKGVHLAIAAVQQYNQSHPDKPLLLKIAGKHYSGTKDNYWTEQIEPQLDDPNIEYVGFIGTTEEKQSFLGNATALVVPSIFDEPLGMVMLEALACATPIIGLRSGSIPEIINHGTTGYIVEKDNEIVGNLSKSFDKIGDIDRAACRQEFESRFTLERMCQEHLAAYQQLTK